MGDQWANLCPLGMPMLSREQRNPLSEWWWTVDRLLLAVEHRVVHWAGKD